MTRYGDDRMRNRPTVLLLHIVLLNIVLFCAMVAHAVRVHADEPKKLTFDGQRAKEYVAHLSTDDMQGRKSCTEGYRKSAEWVADNFKKWGLQPAGEDGTFFQNVEIRSFTWNTGIPSLRVGERDFHLDDQDYALNSISTPGVTVEADVAFVGYGISAAKKGLDEYDGLDVEGKIVLAFKGSPKDAPELRQRFGRSSESGKAEAKKPAETDWTEEAKDATKIKVAYDKGAAGILLFDPDATPSDSSGRRRYSRRSSVDELKPERDFLCFTVTERVFRAIMKTDPQETPRGLKRRMDNLRREIKQKRPQSQLVDVRVTAKGYDEAIRIDKENGNNIARNVLAKIEGSDPELKNEVVLVGAHLDHIGIRDGYVNNGADDNASGSAVVMELARMLAEANYKPRRTLLFCCWCGEELGLIGSLHFVKQPCDGVDINKVVSCFNLDMVGMGEKLGAPGALNFPSIWEVMIRGQDPKIMERMSPSVGGPGGSDHSGFIRKGIQSLALMSSGGVGHQDYHQPEDDIQKIEPEMLQVAGQFVLTGMMNLAEEATVPLLIERRLEKYQAVRMKVNNYNPTLADSSWTQVDLKAADKEQLERAIHEQVRKLIAKPSSESSPASRAEGSARRRSQSGSTEGAVRKSIGRGLTNLDLIGTDTRLLELVIDIHGVGRVDVTNEDGFWFSKGELTDDGKTALKSLEERGVVVRLVSPSSETLKVMLSQASKPFIVTGEYDVPEELVDRLNARGVLFGVGLDPKAVPDFISRVEDAKKRLGERKNLFVWLTSLEGLDDAKQSLYLGLIDVGWARNEIVGSREHGGLLGGATLSKLAE
jgi:hypothetical protein